MRLGLGWSSLLPPTLASEALRPQAPATAFGRARRGLGWLIYSRGNAIGAAGDRPGASASLLVSADGQQAHAAVTNRWVHLDTVTGQLLRVGRHHPA